MCNVVYDAAIKLFFVYNFKYTKERKKKDNYSTSSIFIE